MTPFPETVSDPHRPHFFRWRELGCRFKSRRATSSFFFFHRQFYPSAFYCLFSLLPLLASRDFCENVFLVERGSLLYIWTNCAHLFPILLYMKMRSTGVWKSYRSLTMGDFVQRKANKPKSLSCQKTVPELSKRHWGVLSLWFIIQSGRFCLNSVIRWPLPSRLLFVGDFI